MEPAGVHFKPKLGKKTTVKNFFYFEKWNFLALVLKYFLYFLYFVKWNPPKYFLYFRGNKL